MRLSRRKDIHGAAGMSDTPLFKGGQSTHAASCVSPCMSLHVPACHLPTLYTKYKQSQQEARILYNAAWFCTYEPTQCYGNRLSVPVSQLILVPQTSGRGSQTASIYITTHPFWVLHHTIYARVSSANIPWQGGQNPAPINHNSSTDYSNRQLKHKHCHARQQEPTTIQWLEMPTIPADHPSGIQW